MLHKKSEACMDEWTDMWMGRLVYNYNISVLHVAL